MAHHKLRQSLARRFDEELRFFKGWMDKPRAVGSIVPTSSVTARKMASVVDPSSGLPVLELGPGTGVVTRALIERGVAPMRIVAIEYNPDFCALLGTTYSGVEVIRGDAYDLAATLPAGRSGPFSAVVSSLPLLTRPPPIRQTLVEAALARIPAGAPLIQFSYSFLPPVRPVEGRFSVERSPWVLMNLPPARVWLYRRA